MASSQRAWFLIASRGFSAHARGVRQAASRSFESQMESSAQARQPSASRFPGLRRGWARPCSARRSFWSTWPIPSLLERPTWQSCCFFSFLVEALLQDRLFRSNLLPLLQPHFFQIQHWRYSKNWPAIVHLSVKIRRSPPLFWPWRGLEFQVRIFCQSHRPIQGRQLVSFWPLGCRLILGQFNYLVTPIASRVKLDHRRRLLLLGLVARHYQ